MGAPRFVMEDFWPNDLFLGGIPGAWYDPTDLSTMFQDSTGTTPVTAVEQPVGLILDKSQGLALGVELTPSPLAGSVSGLWQISATAVTRNSSAAVGNAVITLNAALSTTKYYLVSMTVSNLSGDTFFIGLGAGGTGTLQRITANGSYTFRILANGVSATLTFGPWAGTAGEATITNISVRELAGNHASQSTAASRPTYRARYNLLTFSEEFQNAAWTKYVDTTISANVAVAPDGTTTADLMYPATSGTRGLYMAWSGTLTLTTSLYAKASGKSWLQAVGSGGTTSSGVWFNLTAGTVGTQKPGYTGTIQSVGNGWYRCVVSHPVQTNGFFEYRTVDADNVSVVTASGGADGLLIWGAQALTAADVTATGNAYQRIAAATVYDTAPIFRPYLAFDGVDDSLSTAAINFTSTDKMTVFAGVTKSSDAAVAVLAELTADWFTTNGSWVVTAPNSAAANYGNGSRGTFSVPLGSANTFAAPNTAVLTHQSDIAGDMLTLRRNQTQIASSAADQGAGTYANAAMGIGSRTTGTFRFNGRLYSLIVRGAASSTTEIIDTETWVNARTGGY